MHTDTHTHTDVFSAERMQLCRLISRRAFFELMELHSWRRRWLTLCVHKHTYFFMDRGSSQSPGVTSYCNRGVYWLQIGEARVTSSPSSKFISEKEEHLAQHQEMQAALVPSLKSISKTKSYPQTKRGCVVRGSVLFSSVPGRASEPGTVLAE